jgi:hypothetical protein
MVLADQGQPLALSLAEGEFPEADLDLLILEDL